MTEARDALAVALFGQESHDCYDLTTCADAILAALPDGWVLARRQDAEDGAALRELRDALMPPCDIRIRLRQTRDDRMRRLYLVAGEGRLHYADTIAAAARKAREALP
jgi:hypothetical protein